MRGIIAVGISIGLTPIALHGQHVPSEPLALAELVIEGMLVGFGFAFTLSILMAAIESAGAIIDVVSGFSYGELINPMNGQSGAVISRFYSLVGTLIFLMIGGDAWTHTRSRTHLRTRSPHQRTAAQLAGGRRRAGIQRRVRGGARGSGPVLVALLITDVAFGVVSRVVPQLNVFAVGFPVKVAVALLVVGASLPFMANWISEQMSVSVGAALGALHVA